MSPYPDHAPAIHCRHLRGKSRVLQPLVQLAVLASCLPSFLAAAVLPACRVPSAIAHCNPSRRRRAALSDSALSGNTQRNSAPTVTGWLWHGAMVAQTLQGCLSTVLGASARQRPRRVLRRCRLLLLRMTLRRQCLCLLEQCCILRCISVRLQPHCTGRLGDFRLQDSRLKCCSLYLLVVVGTQRSSHILNGLLYASATG
jgi:hypothetical protein